MINFTKITGIITILLITISSMAQEIMPIEDFWDYESSLNDNESPSNVYFKDVNKVLNKYIGTWEGTYDNKFYKFEIIKDLEEFSGVSLKYDVLFMRFKITDSSGDIIENTLNSSDNIIKGSYFDKENNDFYILSYVGDKAECGNSGTIYLAINADQSKIKLYILPDDVLILDEGCPDGYQKPPFPDEDETPMRLAKQE